MGRAHHQGKRRGCRIFRIYPTGKKYRRKEPVPVPFLYLRWGPGAVLPPQPVLRSPDRTVHLRGSGKGRHQLVLLLQLRRGQLCGPHWLVADSKPRISGPGWRHPMGSVRDALRQRDLLAGSQISIRY